MPTQSGPKHLLMERERRPIPFLRGPELMQVWTRTFLLSFGVIDATRMRMQHHCQWENLPKHRGRLVLSQESRRLKVNHGWTQQQKRHHRLCRLCHQHPSYLAYPTYQSLRLCHQHLNGILHKNILLTPGPRRPSMPQIRFHGHVLLMLAS